MSSSPETVKAVIDLIKTPVQTPIDVVNACCTVVETANIRDKTKMNGPEKQNAAVDIVKQVVPMLFAANLISLKTNDTLNEWIDRGTELRVVMNSIISIWNQFKKTGLFARLKAKLSSCSCSSSTTAVVVPAPYQIKGGSLDHDVRKVNSIQRISCGVKHR